MITQDLILKIVGVMGLVGLAGMGIWEIWQNYKKNYRHPEMIVYRFDKEDTEDEASR